MNDYETLKAQNERANEYNRQLLTRNSKLSKEVKSAQKAVVFLTIALIASLITISILL